MRSTSDAGSVRYRNINESSLAQASKWLQPCISSWEDQIQLVGSAISQELNEDFE